MCRSRREVSFQIDPNSNEYLLAKIGVDTAENEPLKVWGKIQFDIHSPPYFQAIVISLKDKLYGEADALVGVYKPHRSEASEVLTLDLRPYAANDAPE